MAIVEWGRVAHDEWLLAAVVTLSGTVHQTSQAHWQGVGNVLKTISAWVPTLPNANCPDEQLSTRRHVEISESLDAQCPHTSNAFTLYILENLQLC